MTRYCVDCKGPDPTRATFGEIGKSPMYCKIHKKEDMIDMKNDRCYCGRGKPSYNVKGEIALYCLKCKQKDMINVVSKMCIDCDERKPSFNVIGKTAQYCGRCVKENKYINMVNVNNKKCAFIEDDIQCTKNPKFNLPGKKGGIYCNEHKPDDRYINVVNKN